MCDDAELLADYHDRKSESAFGELVRRHIDLVYSTAFRVVNGDAHLAEDITQSVFADLARKARVLRKHTSLTGWLYAASRFAAAKAVRTEQRRRIREQEIPAMLHDENASPEWDQLCPHLEDAMESLDEKDREAVLLRYFQKRTFRQVATALQSNEDAARMRVDRAVDKLRLFLERRGVQLTAVALAGAIADQAVTAAPATLAMACASAPPIATTVTAMGGFKLISSLVSAVAVTTVATYLVTDGQRDRLKSQLDTLQKQFIDASEEQGKLSQKNAELEAAAAIREQQLADVRRDAKDVQRLRGLVGELGTQVDNLSSQLNEREAMAKILNEVAELTAVTNEMNPTSAIEAFERKQQQKMTMLAHLGEIYHSLPPNRPELFAQTLNRLDERLRSMDPPVDPGLLPSHFKIMFTNSPAELPFADLYKQVLLIERTPAYRPEGFTVSTNFKAIEVHTEKGTGFVYGMTPERLERARGDYQARGFDAHYPVTTNLFHAGWERLYLTLAMSGSVNFQTTNKESTFSDDQLVSYVKGNSTN